MSILESYKTCCNIRYEYLNTKILDMSPLDFVLPIHLALMFELILDAKRKGKEIILPSNQDAASYFSAMYKIGLRDDRLRGNTYIPLSKLPLDQKDIADLKNDMLSKLSKGMPTRGEQVVGYIIDELITNIYDHSNFSLALVAAQKYKKNSQLTFYDNGITIPHNYEVNNLPFKNDWESVKMAMGGLSTKKEKSRGYGLRSCQNFIKYFEGEMLILSRAGGLYKSMDNKEFRSVSLSDKFKFDGTLVCINTKISKISGKDFYNLVECKNPRGLI